MNKAFNKAFKSIACVWLAILVAWFCAFGSFFL